MRCPSCQKFVSYAGAPEGETTSETLDGEWENGKWTGTLHVDVRAALACGECGEELKEGEFEIDLDVEHDCRQVTEGECPDCDGTGHVPPEGEPAEECETCHGTGKIYGEPDEDLDLDSVDVEGTERTQNTQWVTRGTGANKKRIEVPIRNSRYWKQFYGVSVLAHIECPVCGETIEVEGRDEQQASAWNELG